MTGTLWAKRGERDISRGAQHEREARDERKRKIKRLFAVLCSCCSAHFRPQILTARGDVKRTNQNTIHYRAKIVTFLARSVCIAVEMRSSMASRTPTKVYGPINSFNSLCRFSKKPFLQNSSSIPIFSVTQRQECKGVQLSNLLSEYGIFVQDDSSLSGRSCPKCARRILTSCKTLQEVK